MEVLVELVQMYGAGVGIVIWVLWTNQQRENRYIQVIEKFAKNYEQVKRDVSDIRQKLFEKDDK